MDTEKIIRKYGLKITEKNGKTGVIPTSGKLGNADVAYIKANMAEIITTLTAWATAQKPSISFSDAEIARRTVDALEGKYRQLERNGDTAAAIAARNAYNAALSEWQQKYPTAAAKSNSSIRYNDNATNNPWTN